MLPKNGEAGESAAAWPLISRQLFPMVSPWFPTCIPCDTPPAFPHRTERAGNYPDRQQAISRGRELS